MSDLLSNYPALAAVVAVTGLFLKTIEVLIEKVKPSKSALTSEEQLKLDEIYGFITEAEKDGVPLSYELRKWIDEKESTSLELEKINGALKVISRDNHIIAEILDRIIR